MVSGTVFSSLRSDPGRAAVPVQSLRIMEDHTEREA